MKEFTILVTITTEKMVSVTAPDEESACALVEAVALSTDVLDQAEEVSKDAIAELWEEESDCDDEEDLCSDCIHQCPICGGCMDEE